MGHEVEVIASPPYPEVSEGVILHRLKSLSVYHPESSLRANLAKVRNPLGLYEVLFTRLGMFIEPLPFSIRAYARIKEICKERPFDIIHDNQGLGYGLLLMQRLNIPVIATIHHPLHIDRNADMKQANGLVEKWRIRKFYSFIRMQTYVTRRLERIITVSQSSSGEIQRSFKIPADKLRIVYNGIDTEMYQTDKHRNKERNGLIMVGNTDDRKKGIIYLLEAMQLLEGNGVKLTIVDDAERHSSYADDVGPLPSYGLKLVKKFNLNGQVHFTGRLTREELVEQYTAAEIAIVPSVYEGFGLPAAEAMACGTPVISSDGGALPEVVGDAGILVPSEKADALAVAIKQLLGDKRTQQRMGEAGRKRVEAQFNWEQAARKTLEVYKESLATR